MKYFLFALLFLFPAAAQACYVAPQWATEEHMQHIPEGYLGFKTEILSVNAPSETSTPHEDFTARAKILESYPGNKISGEVTLNFDSCSVVPEAGKTHYFVVQRALYGYNVNDQPKYLVHPIGESR